MSSSASTSVHLPFHLSYLHTTSCIHTSQYHFTIMYQPIFSLHFMPMHYFLIHIIHSLHFILMISTHKKSRRRALHVLPALSISQQIAFLYRFPASHSPYFTEICRNAIICIKEPKKALPPCIIHSRLLKR